MSRNYKGVTLIEVLVVVAILSILTVSLYVVFKSGLDSWWRAETKLKIYQNVRVALGQMSRELALAIEGTVSFKGVTNSVSFIAIIEGSLREITYGLSGSTSTLQAIYVKSDDPNFDYDFSTPDPAVATNWDDLAYNISGLEFKYWREGSTTAWDVDAEDNWTDDWLATGNPRDDLPRAVRITLTDSEESRNFETVIYLPNS